MGAKTKIDWADATWNPVTGCLHGCEYCYAAKIARRFGGKNIAERDCLHILDKPIKRKDESIIPYPFGFAPTFHKYLLDDDTPQRWKKPKNIFVCSMADLFGDWVPDEWIEDVFNACKAAPQHRYLFLTKNTKRYWKLMEAGLLPKNDNFWYGTSITTPRSSYLFSSFKYHTFISIEPMLEDFGDGVDFCGANWIIIGAETGNRKDKVIPEKKWIMEIVHENNEGKWNVPIFMKESLHSIMGDDFRQEFPWEV